MKVTDYLDYLEDLEDADDIKPPRGAAPRGKVRAPRKDDVSTLAQHNVGALREFHPTYSGSRHEHEWIINYLGGFYEDALITDVLRQVKGGKEANVYCCTAGPALGVELIAAKVYRPRMFRNLRNDWLYRQGRDVTDSAGHGAWGRRQQNAIKKRTDFGQGLLHMSWLGSEFGSLSVLHAAGVDVPKPFASNENVILMDYIGEVDWPAPTLHSVSLEQAEARTLFDRVIYNIELMLANGRVHGDLSAHNILYWEGAVTLIDFPQAVDPIINEDSWEIFARDVLRVCQYFSRYGIQPDPQALARDIWRRHQVE
ncbi:MAG TPA: RIO1 family regulatory kinase/ATPase [Chloroflexia bacterium]